MDIIVTSGYCGENGFGKRKWFGKHHSMSHNGIKFSSYIGMFEKLSLNNEHNENINI